MPDCGRHPDWLRVIDGIAVPSSALSGGAIRSDNLDILTNIANIRLSGVGAALTDRAATPNNALQNLSVNGPGGSLVFENGASLNTAFDLENSGTLGILGNTSLVQIGNGGAVYRQTDGETTVDGRLIASNFIIDGGTVGGVGQISADVFNNMGILAPGNSTGVISIDGMYTQGIDGILQIEIGSLGEFDKLSMTDQANLDGILDIQLVNGYQPNIGDTFTILEASSLNGTFSEVLYPGNTRFDIFYSGEGYIQLTAIAVPEPSSTLLLLAGFSTVLARRRRRIR